MTHAANTTQQIVYLTTHDITWINTTVTGRPNHFDWVKLEAAMAAQYQYGETRDIVDQAAGLLNALLLQPPWRVGRRRTALIAITTFLTANGVQWTATPEILASRVAGVASHQLGARQALSQILEGGTFGPPPDESLRQVIADQCAALADSLISLAEGD
ncbi:MAG: hypothetical protein KGJ62_11260 [Armatimonadetes bacterium]|nr:hypothetical protein [Armatimonadota bacterium]MDE2205533.1 hypothetical protein [Armatimonadota bacterium]